jgi:hypothetical protein
LSAGEACGFVGTAPQSDDITMLALRWLSCLSTQAPQPPTGEAWLHEIEHDGFPSSPGTAHG